MIARKPAPLLLLVLALAVIPLTAAAQSPPRIIVEGVGEITVTPDRSQIVFAIETRAAAPEAAAQENARRQEAALQALRAAGVEREDMATIGYGVQPDWQWREGERSLAGYVARTSLRVRTADLDRVGTFIDAAIGAGVDQVEGVSFELSSPDASRREALALAVRNARADAEVMAAAAGGSLGELIELGSGDRGGMPEPQPYMAMRAMAEEASADTQLVVGEQTIQARVRAVWTFRSSGS